MSIVVEYELEIEYEEDMPALEPADIEKAIDAYCRDHSLPNVGVRAERAT